MAYKKATQRKDAPRGLRGIIQDWALLEIPLLILILVVAWMWQTPARKDLPKELWGDWATTDPSYADHTFELDNVCITFTTGEGTISVGFIKDVTEISEGDRTLYTVSYTVDDVPNKVSFYYLPNSGLWFKNQEKIIWKRKEN